MTQEEWENRNDRIYALEHGKDPDEDKEHMATLRRLRKEWETNNTNREKAMLGVVYTQERALKLWHVDAVYVKLESPDQRDKRLAKEAKAQALKEEKEQKELEKQQAKEERQKQIAESVGSTNAMPVVGGKKITMIEFLSAIPVGMAAKLPDGMKMSSVYPIGRQNGLKVRAELQADGSCKVLRFA